MTPQPQPLTKEAIDVLLAVRADELDAPVRRCGAALRELVLAALLELRPDAPKLTPRGRRRADVEQRKLDATPIGGWQ